MSESALEDPKVGELRSQVSGEVVTPEDSALRGGTPCLERHG